MFGRTLPVRRAWIALVVMLLALLATGTAQAHANLVSAAPAAGTTLTTAPAELHLTFSEPLDAASSRVELRDSRGAVVVRGPGTITAAAANQLRLPLPPLADGVYTAVWRARSTVDGHVTEGVVPFGIGANTAPPLPLPAPGTPSPAAALPALLDVALRWVSYLAAAQLVGALLFGLFVWRPVLRVAPHHARQSLEPSLDEQLSAMLRRTIVLAGGALLLTTALFIAYQARQVNPQAWATGLSELLDSRSGALLLLRSGVALVLMSVPTRLPDLAQQRQPTVWRWAALLTLPLLLSFALYSHSGALNSLWQLPMVAASVLHVGAMCAWLGGLLLLAYTLTIGRRTGVAAHVVPTFSRLALLAVVTLAISGVYMAGTHVQTLAALTGTVYGRALIGKSALFGVLIVFGAANLVWLTPHLRAAAGNAGRWIGRNARLEAAVALVLLAFVGVMMGSAPAADALAAQQQLGYRTQVRRDDVRLVLHITPYRVGENVIAVDLFDTRPGAAQAPAEVLVRLRMAERTSSEQQVTLSAAEPLRFATRGNYLTSAGAWQAEVIVRRSGMDDVVQVFDLFPQAATTPPDATGQHPTLGH